MDVEGLTKRPSSAEMREAGKSKESPRGPLPLLSTLLSTSGGIEIKVNALVEQRPLRALGLDVGDLGDEGAGTAADDHNVLGEVGS